MASNLMGLTAALFVLGNAAVFTYRNLEAWQKSMELAEACYRTTECFPKSERYGAASQLRRAAVSIPANIAEGHCRRSTNAYLNHLSIALGSHGELATLLELCVRVGLMNAQQSATVQPLADIVGRLVHGLYFAVERRRV
jgi:four helix bundle protein